MLHFLSISEIRINQQLVVSWRAAVLIEAGNIVAAKVIKFSGSSLQLQCAHLLKDGQVYQLMMEVPDPQDASLRTQIICKATCQYALLSAGEYRAGMKYFDVPLQHHPLLKSWGGRIAVAV